MEVSFCRKMFLSVWEVWEKFFAELNHIQKIRPDGLFRLSTHPYHGPALNSMMAPRSGRATWWERSTFPAATL